MFYTHTPIIHPHPQPQYVTPVKRLMSATAKTWSSLVDGDGQLDQPNSQTTLELCHACVA